MRRRRLALPALVVVLVAALVALVAPSEARAAYLPADAALRREIGRVLADPSVTTTTARVGVAVADGATGNEIYLRTNTTALTPASNLKLFTAGAGMRYLGSGYRWRTETWSYPAKAGTIAGNVYLKGFGDPTLLEADLAAVASAYRARGINRITGGVVADTTFFDDVRYNPTWSGDYRSKWYAAQICALTMSPDTDYDSGTVILAYRARAYGQTPTLSVWPPSAAAYVRIVNRAVSVYSSGTDTLAASRPAGSNTITVTGAVPWTTTTQKEWVTVEDPALLTAHVLRAQFARYGIRVEGSNTRGAVPAGASLYTRKWSMTIGQLLTPFLKLSNNGHAEIITKTMGTRYGRAGNWTDGISHIRAYAAGLGVPLTGATLVDGSGLSRGNRITASQLVGLVYRIQREPWSATFKAALPVAAGQPVRWVGGTLATRMVGTSAAYRVRAKTGTLSGVTSLAGYATGADGRPYVFAMISNYTYTSPRFVEDRLAELLARWRMTNP